MDAAKINLWIPLLAEIDRRCSLAAIHDLHTLQPEDAWAPIACLPQVNFVGDNYDPVVVCHEPFRRRLERIADAFVDLCSRAKERTDIRLQESPAVFFIDETKCLAGDNRHGVVVIGGFAGNVDTGRSEEHTSELQS